MTANVTDRSMSRCGNCQRLWPTDALLEPSDLWERLDPGSEVPSGECPGCGALSYLVAGENVPQRHHLISVGDHSTPDLGIGLCASIVARSKEEALARFQYALGDVEGIGVFELDLRDAQLLEGGLLSSSDGEYITVYIEPSMISVAMVTDEEDVEETEK